MRIIVGAGLYLVFALLAGTFLDAYLRQRFSLPRVPSLIVSQVVALCCAWVLLMLLFSL